MTKAGAYAEEIYDREESYWDGISYDDALDSLLRDQNGKLVRDATPMIIEIAENLAKPTSLGNDIEAADSLTRIDEIEKEVASIEISSAKRKLRDSLATKKAELKLAEEITIAEETVRFERDITENDDYALLGDLRKEIIKSVVEDKKTLLKSLDDKREKIAEELAEITEKRKEQRLKEEAETRQRQKELKAMDSIQEGLKNTKSISEVYRYSSRLDNIELENTDELKGLVNDKLREIEEEKERNKQRQQEARESKERLREKGYEPDF